MTYENILVEQRGAVTLITLNRPQGAQRAQQRGPRRADRMPSPPSTPTTSQRCAVLTGSERAFAAGADIKEMSDQGFASMYGSNFFQGWEKVTATRKPWIAAVAGYALGGGCEVAMMADFIIAADTAQFGQPEIKLGVTPGMGGSQRLTRAVGKAKAMEMCLTGRMMGAEEAERSGLVARVVPAAELLDEALKTAEAIAVDGRRSPRSPPRRWSTPPSRPASPRASSSSAACSTACSGPRTRRKAWRLRRQAQGGVDGTMIVAPAKAGAPAGEERGTFHPLGCQPSLA